MDTRRRSKRLLGRKVNIKAKKIVKSKGVIIPEEKNSNDNIGFDYSGERLSERLDSNDNIGFDNSEERSLERLDSNEDIGFDYSEERLLERLRIDGLEKFMEDVDALSVVIEAKRNSPAKVVQESQNLIVVPEEEKRDDDDLDLAYLEEKLLEFLRIDGFERLMASIDAFAIEIVEIDLTSDEDVPMEAAREIIEIDLTSDDEIEKKRGEEDVPKEAGDKEFPKEAGEEDVPKEAGEEDVPKEAEESVRDDGIYIRYEALMETNDFPIHDAPRFYSYCAIWKLKIFFNDFVTGNPSKRRRPDGKVSRFSL